MKRVYSIVLVALSIVVLAWFLPWLYSLVFPVAGSDPFVAMSPVCDGLVVSELGDNTGKEIFLADADGQPTGKTITKEERDSLLPQIYFTQLMARGIMPDTIKGIEASMQNLKHGQWVFSTIPHDVNKVLPEVYLIMESMPARIDLEDPDEVFRFRDGKVEFIEMATNTVNSKRTERFTHVFNDRGFTLPLRSWSANITSRKAYDNGYLLADANGDIFHLKMQAGRPYMVKLDKPDSLVAEHVFVMENMDGLFLGFVTDTENNLYAIEQDGYGIVPLAVGKFDPEKERMMVTKNIFNTVYKISGEDGSRWTAVDSRTYEPIARYARTWTPSLSEKVEEYIFPFALSFTSTSDSLAKPRIDFVSWRAVFLNIVLAIIVVVVFRRRRRSVPCTACAVVLTLVSGIFAFIPYVLIHN